MKNLVIKNIGPVKDIDINLNKVNILMGPQSSGKSIIAKIISYCQWVEKRFILDGEYKYDFLDQFIEFHRIDINYFNEESFFKYESNFISITHSGLEKEDKIIQKSENLEYQKSKNIYIPAERNFVSVIPNLGKFKESNDNIMSFLYDWYDTKKTYSKTNSLPILNLDVQYHHIEEKDADMLTLLSNEKEISLKNASSGLQSVIPLTMLIDYLTDGFYDKKDRISVNESDQTKALIDKKIQEYKHRNSDNAISKKKFDLLLNLLGNRQNYHYSSFIIEEPEQNLFPSTQRDLIYFLINKINSTKRNHTLTLTTHSPYVLYALNNCMLGFRVKKVIPADVKQELLCSESLIDPDCVSIWEIEKGTLKSIKNKETGSISKHYFNKIMNEVMDEYYEMLNYLEL